MKPPAIVKAHAMLSERLPFKSVHALSHVVSQATRVVSDLEAELQAL
jgi:hypothetical protein